MLPAAVEVRLLEWARWCRSCGHRRGRASSAEGAYRSPQHWASLPEAPRPPIASHRAIQVEHAVGVLAELHRVTIVSFYVWLAPEPVLRRRLRRWNVKDTRPVLEEARRRVGIALAGGESASRRAAGSQALGIIAPGAFYAIWGA